MGAIGAMLRTAVLGREKHAGRYKTCLSRLRVRGMAPDPPIASNRYLPYFTVHPYGFTISGATVSPSTICCTAFTT